MKRTFITLISNDNPKLLLWGIVVLLVVLLIAVMIFSSVECFLMSLTGIKTKPEIIKLIGWGIGGLVAILGVKGLLQRATALDKQNEMTEKGHIHERFKAAIEHLGTEYGSVRIAAFYEFYRLAKLETEQGLKETIFDILCAHLRQTTQDENYQKEGTTSGPPESASIKPTEEVQNLLNVLFKPDKDEGEDKFIFNGLVANLEGVYLQGANLCKANLQKAKLQGANLQGADLNEAKLQKAKLQDAKMQHAFLIVAKLQGVYMWNTKLQNAKMQNAYLQGADMKGPGVDMEAEVDGADMGGAKINEYTHMPNEWKKQVKRNNRGKTGASRVDDKGNVVEWL